MAFQHHLEHEMSMEHRQNIHTCKAMEVKSNMHQKLHLPYINKMSGQPSA